MKYASKIQYILLFIYTHLLLIDELNLSQYSRHKKNASLSCKFFTF